jgi:AAA domain
LTNPEMIEKGKVLAESGRYRPTPNDLPRKAHVDGVARNGGPIPLPTPEERSTRRVRDRNARRREDRDQQEVPKSLLTGLMSAADLDTMTFPALVEHVPHLITEGFGVLAGPPKAGKSWFVGGIALACAYGGTALGSISVQPRHVLLLALEDGPRRLQTRMRRLNADQPLPRRLDILTDIAPGTVIATISEWLDRHRDDNTKPLVILDTLGKARPQRRAGDDPYIADYQLGSRIKATVDAVPGAALVAVHHTRKMGAEDWLDTVSGTQGISGSADYILVLRRKRKSDEGTIAVTGRDVAENEYAVKTDNGIWTLDGMDILDAAATVTTRAERQQTRLGDRSHDAVKFVNSRPTTTPKDLADHLSVDSRIASVMLGRLRDGEYIQQHGRGVYAPVTVVTVVSDETAGQPLPGITTPTTLTTPGPA